MATKILQITIGLLAIGWFIYLCFFKVYVIYKPHTTHGQPTEVKGIAAYRNFSNTALHFLSNYNQTLDGALVEMNRGSHPMIKIISGPAKSAVSKSYFPFRNNSYLQVILIVALFCMGGLLLNKGLFPPKRVGD